MAESTKKRLILGVGTGRSGTETLAGLLNAQPNACMSHEFALFTRQGERAARHRRPLPWLAPPDVVAGALDALLLYEGDFVGDIGSYWLPHIPGVLESRSNLRVICVSRPEEDVVRSFLAKTAGRNHWMTHDGSTWRCDHIWDPVYPKYDVTDKEEALRNYWREYAAQSERLRERFPAQFGIWQISDLNDPRGIVDMLTFAGFDPETIEAPVVVRKNRGRTTWRAIARRIMLG